MNARFGFVRLVAGMITAAGSSAVAAESAPPPFATVEAAVVSRLATGKDYQPGDLLSRNQVQTVLNDVAKLGWKPANQQELLAAVLPESSFLVRMLHDPDSRDFMRSVAEQPNGYDLVDRMSRLSHGQQTVRELIFWWDGSSLIEYMATTSGGKHFGRFMADFPHGKDFNEPTNRIYTQDQLISRLRKQYDTERKAATRGTPVPAK